MKIDNIEFTKPQRNDPAMYACQIYNNENSCKKIVKIEFKNVKIVGFSLKNNVISLKNTSMHRFMFDLNAHVTNTVKKNYNAWFVNAMDLDLIDEYYSNTLSYDKQHGDIIKLHNVGAFSDSLKGMLNKTCNIRVSFNKLKFFKQKFYLECSIIAATPSTSMIKDEDMDHLSDDETPEPPFEVLQTLKQSFLEKLQAKQVAVKNLTDLLSKSVVSPQIIKSCAQAEAFFASP